ncbi:exosome non-catalytic core subunit rrp40 [Orbilia oligospora]|uniref:Exosome non-catalytic core subunit rrp40 n=1 Tax=Orbilia oligospora TaxID=2813651 RepID=A0A7C8J265_ORBOL|nr:exosome non-catalytic core subunit rrp40 [Orbilia oligospora]KAF3096518.1 exosome non-catalytic core subunit rrp40 [Orbilia oligospora]
MTSTMSMSLDSPEIILPGDPLPQLSPLLSPPSTETTTDTKPRSLRLGPGLTLSPTTPSTPILPYRYGTLNLTSHTKRPTASILSTPRHYHPSINDPVLVTLLRTTAEQFIVQLTPYTPPAIIPFENYIINNAGTTASARKSRPNLPIGATIYARVAVVHKHLESVELSVPDPTFGEVISQKNISSSSSSSNQKNKKDSSSSTSISAGTTTGASSIANRAEVTPYILSTSQPMTKLLLAEETLGKPLLSAVASKVPFEMIVGKNGRVWIDATTQKEVIQVVRCFKEFDEAEAWNDEDGGLTKGRQIVGKVCGKRIVS